MHRDFRGPKTKFKYRIGLQYICLRSGCAIHSIGICVALYAIYTYLRRYCRDMSRQPEMSLSVDRLGAFYCSIANICKYIVNPYMITVRPGPGARKFYSKCIVNPYILHILKFLRYFGDIFGGFEKWR